MKPVFLFSLPRSGSTLFQKLLMTHPKIGSVAEPWLLLPFAHTLKKKGTITQYSHSTSYYAFKDFVNNLGGEEVYYKELANFASKLYASVLVDNQTYFLDKTPRYYWIISDIAKMFPNAKFIFLFRHPLAIYSSVLKTWQNNRLITHANYADLNEGPNYLADGYKLLQNKSIMVNYEELISNQESEMRRVAEYLDLSYNDFSLESFKKQDLKGVMGDSLGIKQYQNVSSDSIQTWKETFNSKYRKRVVYKYVESLSSDYLSYTGFSKEELLAEIQTISAKYLGVKDALDFNTSKAWQLFKAKTQTTNARNLFLKGDEKNLYS
ncbi:sulfotransferase family protein [Virgibacillus litoralis]|uniref:Sulfotransferase n=1 Tax=Virgibacillus litoralis TaxID=578221 RepID=A0ABS4HI17_9BACI|nr:sulfotransferase [Virgibacillus litoralis]MBP1950562.1 hypothetical protein [Virgibacillus litoralis]